MKLCSDCKRWKAPDCFSKNRTRNDGLQSVCKRCHSQRSQKWNDDHPKEYRASYARYRRKSLYGLSDADFQELFRAQGGKCAICRQPGKLDVDHDHQTKKVRGLLCRKCNLGVGIFQESAERLMDAATYLHVTR